MAKRKSIRFRGWDWTELLQLKYIAGKQWPEPPERLEIETHMSQEDYLAAYSIKKYLGNLMMCGECNTERKAAVRSVRRFCTALSKCRADYSAPVYAAMAKIENDDTLLQWVIRNLECMWN